MQTFLIKFNTSSGRSEETIDADSFIVIPRGDIRCMQNRHPEASFLIGDGQNEQQQVEVLRITMRDILSIKTTIVSAPEEIYPAVGVVTFGNNPPKLSWGNTGSPSYSIEIATDAGFANIVTSTTVIVTTFDILLAPMPGGLSSGTYYARVGNSTADTAKSVVQFELLSQGVYPAVNDLHFVTMPFPPSHTLSWNATGSPSFTIQLSNAADFINLLVNEPSWIPNTFILPPDAPAGIYYARVKNNSPDEAWNTLQFEIPVVVYPVVTDLVYDSSMINLHWNGASSSYYVEIATDAGFLNLFYTNPNVGIDPFLDLSQLSPFPPGTYYARVRNNNPDITWALLTFEKV